MQGDLNILEAELTEQAAKIKTTEDMIKQGCVYGFLILILGKDQCRRVIGNDCLQWETPEDLGRYSDLIQAKDMAFNQLIEYEKFLGGEGSLQILSLQAVDDPFLEALKE